MAQIDNHPDSKTRQRRQHRQELAPHQSSVLTGHNAGKAPATLNTDIHPIQPAPHEIRMNHKTCTTMSANITDVAAGISFKTPALRTVLIALNLTAALDKVHLRQQECNGRNVKTGVVQGGVLSPALFNCYLVDFPIPPPNIKRIKYDDDITIYTSGPVVADLINGLNIYLSQVLNYINNKKLTVSTAKYTVTLFTPDTHEHHLHPQVNLADLVLPLKKKPNVLGVMLDTSLTFTQHCNNIGVKVQQRNNVLKALAGSTWGCDKETLLSTNQAIGRSILSYCCHVRTPSHMDPNRSRLQRAQNLALRIATGCLKIADVAELQQEARDLRVSQRNELTSQQFALACHLSQHPCHQLRHRPSDDRPDYDDLCSAGLNLTSSNTTPKSHSSTPATSRPLAASTKMRSELQLKAARHNCLIYIYKDNRVLRKAMTF